MRTVLEILGLFIVFYVAARLGIHRGRHMGAPKLPPVADRCEHCGSDTLYNGVLIHYTDCKTGLG